MNDKTTVIYRHPDHAGRKPVTKNVKRGELPMLTLDPHRLARAGSVQRTSITGRRRALAPSRWGFGWRAVAILLLLVALLVVALVTTSRARAQTFEISALCMNCVFVPEVGT